MANWLLKTEPNVYSFADLQRDKKTMWDGIKNNLALKHLKTVKKGDRCIIYHTGGLRICVGLGRATTGAYADPEKDDPRLLVFDIKVGKALPREVSLAEMKLNPKLEGFDLLRLGRLSFVPVSDAHYDVIMEMAKG
jgi:predicted RNA-binding protein with PUA-like domain